MPPRRTFAIRYSRISRVWLVPLQALFFLGRAKVELTESSLDVRWGWAFRASIPRASIRRGALHRDVWWAIGVHSDLRLKSWLVNASKHGVVFLDILPPARGRSGPFRITIERLGLGLEDPEGFLRELQR